MSQDTGWSAGKLLGVSGSYWQACALHAAVKLNLFTRLGSESLSAPAIAGRCGADERGMGALLNALCAMAILQKSEDRFANTAASRSLLLEDSPDYVGHIIRHHHHLMDAWRRLDLAVTTGEPVESRGVSEEERRKSFLMGMYNIARILAPRVAEAVDLSGKKHLLDLGGGPGTYAVFFCLSNPELRATVYDLPTSRPFAQETIAKFGLAGRIAFQGGDYLKDPIEGVYDVAWLSNILHSEGPEGCQAILHKAAAVLSSGGSLFIHEFILEDTLDRPLFPALFALNMLVNTRQGRSYAEGELRGMMERAGLRDVRRLPFRSPQDSGIMAGDKP